MGQDPDTIRQEIAETRERLGDTAEALAYKTDVKARAGDRLDEIKVRADHATERVPGGSKSLVGGAVAGSLLLLLAQWRRGRR